MSRVKQSKTAPEERVAAALRALNFAYRRNVRSLPGTPDFANRSKSWAIQVHGCFWHQHDCRRATIPAHNREAWTAKFARNRERDMAVEALLSEKGLIVLTIWECETKNAEALRAKIATALDRDAQIPSPSL